MVHVQLRMLLCVGFLRILLPPMGSEERAEVSYRSPHSTLLLHSIFISLFFLLPFLIAPLQLSKLASIYRIRCRYNKSTQVASSTLIKARYRNQFSILLVLMFFGSPH